MVLPGSLAIPSSVSNNQNLLLDSSIRDWVVLPLLIIMIAAGLLRHYMGILMKGKPAKIPPTEARVRSCLTRYVPTYIRIQITHKYPTKMKCKILKMEQVHLKPWHYNEILTLLLLLLLLFFESFKFNHDFNKFIIFSYI